MGMARGIGLCSRPFIQSALRIKDIVANGGLKQRSWLVALWQPAVSLLGRAIV